MDTRRFVLRIYRLDLCGCKGTNCPARMVPVGYLGPRGIRVDTAEEADAIPSDRVAGLIERYKAEAPGSYLVAEPALIPAVARP